MRTDEHPTVVAVRSRSRSSPDGAAPALLTSEQLRQMCLDAGADDAGVVALEDPAVASERAEAERALPGAKSLLAFVVRMNRDSVRSALHTIANLQRLARRRERRARDDARSRRLSPSCPPS